MPIGPKVCVASEPFNHDELRIQLSDLDEGAGIPILRYQARFCVKGVIIEMLSADPS